MRKFFYISVLVFLVSAFFFRDHIEAYWQKDDVGNFEISVATSTPQQIEKKDRVASYEIGEGMTFAKLMTDQASTSYSFAIGLYDASLPVYDLTKIKVGKSIELVYDKDTDVFKELRYKIDTEDELFVFHENASSSAWKAEKRAIPYEVRTKVARGTVKSSMYQAALDNGIDERAIIELANAFQWSIDFAMDPRVGDNFEFIYEERYLDGEYVMPGRVFAGKYVNDGNELAVYYFEEDEKNKGYFDKDGNSAQRMFLKAPVEFRYISSGFTTGLRYVEAFNVSTGHRAIDYAAAAGTPIRAVGDGLVTSASYSKAGYGNLISLRHNGTYSTNYAHLSKFAVKSGQRVKQGDIIGYVGSTGFSTGPHLHYEMVKDGIKINPLADVQPPGEPIRAENKDRFLAEMAALDEKIRE